MTNSYPTGEHPASFAFSVGLGRIPGVMPEFLIGVNPGAAINVEEQIWDNGGVRSNIGAPSPVYVSSSDAGDIAVVVVIQALDVDYNRVLLAGVLNGQGQVQALNVAGGGNDVVWVQAAILQGGAAGDVYIALLDGAIVAGVPQDAAKIQSKIIAGNGITRNIALMVPKGKAAFAVAIRGNTDLASKVARVITQITRPGQVPLRTVEYELTAAWSGLQFPVPVGVNTFASAIAAPSFPEGTILEYTAVANANGTRIFFGVDMLLVDVGFIGGAA